MTVMQRSWETQHNDCVVLAPNGRKENENTKENAAGHVEIEEITTIGTVMPFRNSWGWQKKAAVGNGTTFWKFDI